LLRHVGDTIATMGRVAIVSYALITAACIPPPATTGNGTTTYDPVTPYDPNSSRTVSIVSALVGPGKNSGKPWDGPGDISAASHEVASTLATIPNPYTAAASIGAILAGPTAAGFEPPDVGGAAELYYGPQPTSTLELATQQDSYTPQWTSVRWTGVDVRGARLRLVFVDKDLANDDAVGVVDIDSMTLMQAASSQNGRLLLRVAEQTYNQILFVDLSVL
jgi:hypothetical protein